MLGLEGVLNFFRGLDRKEIERYLYIYVAAFLLIVGGLLYRHFTLSGELDVKIKLLNKARKELQTIMTEYGTVKQQKEQVDALLKKDKNFYLQKYFQDVAQSVNIGHKATTNFLSQTLPNGYIEESLQIRFNSLTTQELCEFLQKLELTPRVYAKNLDISSKGLQSRAISVSMAIATLKPQEESSNKR